MTMCIYICSTPSYPLSGPHQGDNSLHVAVAKKSMNTVKFLLDEGMNVSFSINYALFFFLSLSLLAVSVHCSIALSVYTL